MRRLKENSQVSAAEMVASIVVGAGSSINIAAVRSVSYRVPVSMLARVDALAEKSGKSRNAMLNLLVDVGLEEVLSLLSENDFQELQSREMMAIQELLDGETETLTE